MSEEGYGAYDPTAPEDGPGRSQYVTKKDVRVVGVAIVFIVLLGYPVFKMLERRAQRSVCATNIGAIANAISQYAVLHDDRFPPLMRTGANNEPDLGDSGKPYTWASDIAELMSPRSTFRCPSATDEEVTWIEGQKSNIALTYGMYVAYGSYLRTLVANPDQTILIAETSNHGSEHSFDPIPYKGPYDGFAIGWNKSNDTPSKETDVATRLAFRDTANGKFSKSGESRHDGGIHALNIEGAMVTIKPTDAQAPINRGLPGGLWTSPPANALVH